MAFEMLGGFGCLGSLFFKNTHLNLELLLILIASVFMMAARTVSGTKSKVSSSISRE